jgi:hypothetical protein
MSAEYRDLLNIRAWDQIARAYERRTMEAKAQFKPGEELDAALNNLLLQRNDAARAILDAEAVKKFCNAVTFTYELDHGDDTGSQAPDDEGVEISLSHSEGEDDENPDEDDKDDEDEVIPATQPVELDDEDDESYQGGDDEEESDQEGDYSMVDEFGVGRVLGSGVVVGDEDVEMTGIQPTEDEKKRATRLKATTPAPGPSKPATRATRGSTRQQKKTAPVTEIPDTDDEFYNDGGGKTTYKVEESAPDVKHRVQDDNDDVIVDEDATFRGRLAQARDYTVGKKNDALTVDAAIARAKKMIANKTLLKATINEILEFYIKGAEKEGDKNTYATNNLIRSTTSLLGRLYEDYQKTGENHNNMPSKARILALRICNPATGAPLNEKLAGYLMAMNRADLLQVEDFAGPSASNPGPAANNHVLTAMNEYHDRAIGEFKESLRATEARIMEQMTKMKNSVVTALNKRATHDELEEKIRKMEAKHAEVVGKLTKQHEDSLKIVHSDLNKIFARLGAMEGSHKVIPGPSSSLPPAKPTAKAGAKAPAKPPTSTPNKGTRGQKRKAAESQGSPVDTSGVDEEEDHGYNVKKRQRSTKSMFGNLPESPGLDITFDDIL